MYHHSTHFVLMVFELACRAAIVSVLGISIAAQYAGSSARAIDPPPENSAPFPYSTD